MAITELQFARLRIEVMNTIRTNMSCRILFLILAAIFTANPAFAQSQTPLHIDINFSQHFEVTACPAKVPAGNTCLNVTGIAEVSGWGHVSVQRIVFFNAKLYDANHPTCIPDETSGTLNLSGGTLTFRAPGNVCLADGTASYALIITGGTGRYVGAIGGGQITVPPPQSNSTGRELWHIELYMNVELKA